MCSFSKGDITQKVFTTSTATDLRGQPYCGVWGPYPQWRWHDLGARTNTCSLSGCAAKRCLESGPHTTAVDDALYVLSRNQLKVYFLFLNNPVDLALDIVDPEHALCGQRPL